jgi:hypothetical protein
MSGTDVADWHLCDMPTSTENVCFLGHFGSPVSGSSGPVLTHNGSRALAICGAAARVESTLAAPDLISARSQLFVRRKGPLEVVVFLAGNQAEIFQSRQQLLGLGGLAEYQIGLAEMLMGATVAGI